MKTVPLAPIKDKSGHFSVSSPMILMFGLGLSCLEIQCLSLAYFLVRGTPYSQKTIVLEALLYITMETTYFHTFG